MKGGAERRGPQDLTDEMSHSWMGQLANSAWQNVVEGSVGGNSQRDSKNSKEEKSEPTEIEWRSCTVKMAQAEGHEGVLRAITQNTICYIYCGRGIVLNGFHALSDLFLSKHKEV